MFYSGENNLITDVDGILVGNAEDKEIGTGTTILIPPKGSTAGADVRGGAPGTREVGALNPYNLVDTIDAIVLSGGSAWGLEAASSAANYIGKSGRGFKTSENIKNVPMIPAAILFDLNNGGNKDWGDEPPYNNLGIEASTRASEKFQLGNVGAGYGAKAGSLKGGLGSASFENKDIKSVKDLNVKVHKDLHLDPKVFVDIFYKFLKFLVQKYLFLTKPLDLDTNLYFSIYQILMKYILERFF